MLEAASEDAVSEGAFAMQEEETPDAGDSEVAPDIIAAAKDDNIEDKKEKPRFVPEGMALPMGEEDEDDLVPNFNMNRPEMAEIGILSVGENKKARKDDFDLDISPDDDFDI